ncbi:anti-CBASS protein Acb1 family protein [Haloarcula pelagica]|uniref:anti-CBASS protein Acb1 family protein n=1 Tax=Haloarcula pelagica TaxID=3033389 RepID=UPI0024C32199|nr:anti-CBASS Acb1 family protein [Halomicroarcula sp. YJ-61-S]
MTDETPSTDKREAYTPDGEHDPSGAEPELTANEAFEQGLRLGIARELGASGFQERDRYDAFGWEVNPSEEEYVGLYLRNPYCGGLIDKPAQLAWRHDPDIQDAADVEDQTDFEEAVDKLARNLDFWAYCTRVQQAAGFGEFALLFIDFDDTDKLDDLNDPVEYDNGSLDNIRGFRVIPQFAVDDRDFGDFGDDDGRWGEPTHYTVDWSEDIDDDTEDSEGAASNVHHSRVIEVPSKPPLTEEYQSRSRMERWLNTLYDIEKLLGSAAEMAYRGADKGLHVNYDPTKVDPSGLDDASEDIQEWYHGLEPVLKTVGGEVNDLGGDIRDPTGALEAELKSLSAATGFSKQFIEGAAAGEIASSETNMRNDFGEVRERQRQYITPYITRRGLMTLANAGVLPMPEGGSFDVDWPDLFELSDKEIAEIEQKRSQTAKNLGLMGEPAQDYVAEGEFAASTAPSMPLDESSPAVANQFDALSGVVANATVTMDPDIAERYIDEFGEDAFVPPEAAQEKAQRILDIREDEDSVNGGTDTGWRRAEQIAGGGPIPPDEVRQIDAWFSRHPKSEASDAPDDEPWTDNGWTARMLWGWDATADWAADLAADIREFEDEDQDQSGNTTANATRYEEGDTVSTPQGVGVVADVLTETVETDEDTVEASDSSPTYVVVVEDARVGYEIYKAGDIHSTTIETDVDPTEEIAANTDTGQGILEVLGILSSNSDFSPPPSWRNSSTPSRIIALKAFASMGGSFDGCVREMRGSVSSPDRFCGSFLDYVVGNPYWRGDSILPGD